MNDTFEAVVRMTKHGYSAAAIAAHLGTTKRSVQRWRHKAGLSQPTNNNGPVTQERLAEAKRLLDDGASRAEVQRTLHISQRTMREHFPGCGWSNDDALEFARAVQHAYRIGRRT